MALLTVTAVASGGTATNLAAVTASDTISGTDIGSRGVILDVNNANAGTCTVTVSDPGTTDAGNPAAGAATTVSITTGVRKRIFVGPANVNPATGLATITYSPTSSVTAEAIRY
jgi:hypothetical protein